MKIGILTFAAVANFGANLQAISTYYFLRKEKHQPIIIDWIPDDFQKSIDKSYQNIQGACHIQYVRDLLQFSNLCRTSKDVAQEIDRLGLDAVIIGSDAVLQHHSFWERIKFPTKKLFYYAHYESTQIYPNAFWGDFYELLSKKIPLAVMSGSSQSSKYSFILGGVRRRMKNAVNRFSYISVRDSWTQKMILHITQGEIKPPITPDPVFAFNYNCNEIIPTKEEILQKFKLPSQYALVSFRNKQLVKALGPKWFDDIKLQFSSIGVKLIGLPMPMGYIDGLSFSDKVETPLLPVDWYALIKYSFAYIGENMHPTVVSLSNSVPVFCFDDYTAFKFYDTFPIRNSSKIEHIMNVFGHPDNRCDVGNRIKNYPEPREVFEKIIQFDKEKCSSQSEKYLAEYLNMMNNMLRIIIK